MTFQTIPIYLHTHTHTQVHLSYLEKESKFNNSYHTPILTLQSPPILVFYFILYIPYFFFFFLIRILFLVHCLILQSSTTLPTFASLQYYFAIIITLIILENWNSLCNKQLFFFKTHIIMPIVEVCIYFIIYKVSFSTLYPPLFFSFHFIHSYYLDNYVPIFSYSHSLTYFTTKLGLRFTDQCLHPLALAPRAL